MLCCKDGACLNGLDGLVSHKVSHKSVPYPAAPTAAASCRHHHGPTPAALRSLLAELRSVGTAVRQCIHIWRAVGDRSARLPR